MNYHQKISQAEPLGNWTTFLVFRWQKKRLMGQRGESKKIPGHHWTEKNGKLQGETRRERTPWRCDAQNLVIFRCEHRRTAVSEFSIIWWTRFPKMWGSIWIHMNPYESIWIHGFPVVFFLEFFWALGKKSPTLDNLTHISPWISPGIDPGIAALCFAHWFTIWYYSIRGKSRRFTEYCSIYI